MGCADIIASTSFAGMLVNYGQQECYTPSCSTSAYTYKYIFIFLEQTTYFSPKNKSNDLFLDGEK